MMKPEINSMAGTTIFIDRGCLCMCMCVIVYIILIRSGSFI